jgi:hypothetical protein
MNKKAKACDVTITGFSYIYLYLLKACHIKTNQE